MATTTTVRESYIEDYLIARAKARGGLLRKVKWIGRHGAPDRVLMLPGGIIIWIELKAPGEVPEDHQLREHKRMRDMGQVVMVIDSLDGVDRLLP